MKKFKCAIIGDAEVGKTSLIRSHFRGGFHTHYIPTYLEKYIVQVSDKNGPKYEIEFWDAGHTKNFLKAFSHTDLFLVCFSVGSQTSFSNVEKEWVSKIQKYAPSSPLFLIGCKSDLRKEPSSPSSKLPIFQTKKDQSISFKQGQALARKVQALGYLECSSLLGSGLKDIFDEVITNLMLRIQTIKSKLPNFSINNNIIGINHVFSENTEQPTNTESNSSLSNPIESSELSLKFIEHSLIKCENDEENNKFDVDSSLDNGGSFDNLKSEAAQVIENIDILLKKPGFSIADFFNEEYRGEILKEFRLRNKELIDFIATSDNILYLISILNKGTASPQELFFVSELLTGDIPAILDIFCHEDNKLWNKLFHFLNLHSPPFSESVILAANFFNKVASFLIRKRSIEFIHFIQRHMDFVTKLIDNIDLDCFVQLLLTMIESEVQISSVVNLRWSERFVSYLGEKLASCYSIRKYVEGIHDLIESLSNRCPDSPISNQLLSDYIFVRTLVKYSLEDNFSIAQSHIGILLLVLKFSTNKKEYENTRLPGIIEELLQLQEQDNPSIEKPIKKLYRLLYTRPFDLPCSIEIASEPIAPLGIYRLKLVQLVSTLISTNYHFVDNELIEHRILSRVIDLFFQFKWNNILHCTIQQMVVFILETKPPYLSLHLLRDCHLLDRILQVQQNEEQEKSIQQAYNVEKKFIDRIPHHGYTGHLLLIGSAISRASHLNSAIFYLLEDIPNRGWKKLDEKLKLYNQPLKSANSASITCHFSSATKVSPPASPKQQVQVQNNSTNKNTNTNTNANNSISNSFTMGNSTSRFLSVFKI